MHELSLMCPQDRVEVLSEALDALDALSVSVEDADAQTDAEQALFGEPGMPPPSDGWQRSRVVALFATETGAQDARGTPGRPVLGAADPVAVFAGRDHCGFLDRSDMARATGTGTAHHSPGPRAGVWNRYAPDDTHVFALDR